MLKKSIVALMVTAFTFMLSSNAYLSQAATEKPTIRVMSNGKFLTLPKDTPPIIENGRTLLPLRALLNQLGVSDQNIQWDEKNQTVHFAANSRLVSLKINSPVATVSGSSVNLDAPAIIHKMRTYIPLRFTSTALGKQVEWDKDFEVAFIANPAFVQKNQQIIDKVKDSLSKLKSGTSNYMVEMGLHNVEKAKSKLIKVNQDSVNNQGILLSKGISMRNFDLNAKRLHGITGSTSNTYVKTASGFQYDIKEEKKAEFITADAHYENILYNGKLSSWKNLNQKPASFETIEELYFLQASLNYPYAAYTYNYLQSQDGKHVLVSDFVSSKDFFLLAATYAMSLPMDFMTSSQNTPVVMKNDIAFDPNTFHIQYFNQSFSVSDDTNYTVKMTGVITNHNNISIPIPSGIY